MIELLIPGSAVRLASVARHVIDCAMRPGKSRVMVLVHDTLSHCALEVYDSFNSVQLTEWTKNCIFFLLIYHGVIALG